MKNMLKMKYVSIGSIFAVGLIVASLNVAQASGPSAWVRSAQLFYNNSNYDGKDPSANNADFNAIASNKYAYLGDSGRSTFANVSSYSKGINGVIIDIVGNHPNIGLNDFTFRIGNNDAPHTWSAPIAPTLTSVNKPGATPNEQFVTLIWPDGTLKNTWLQVTVKENGHTGIEDPYTFYFGNAVADSGSGDTLTAAITDYVDELAARQHPATLLSHIAIYNPYDYNRDAKVDATDQILARNNTTTELTALRFINLGSHDSDDESHSSDDND